MTDTKLPPFVEQAIYEMHDAVEDLTNQTHEGTSDAVKLRDKTLASADAQRALHAAIVRYGDERAAELEGGDVNQHDFDAVVRHCIVRLARHGCDKACGVLRDLVEGDRSAAASIESHCPRNEKARARTKNDPDVVAGIRQGRHNLSDAKKEAERLEVVRRAVNDGYGIDRSEVRWLVERIDALAAVACLPLAPDGEKETKP